MIAAKVVFARFFGVGTNNKLWGKLPLRPPSLCACYCLVERYFSR